MAGSKERSVVGLFGGSFNPPHIGHVLAVAYVLSQYELDGVLVVPVYQHPFDKELAPFEQRLSWCELALGWLPGVTISAVERELGGESRTLRTVEELRQNEPQRSLRLVIGADVLSDLHKWHRFDRIAELARPIVIGRSGVVHPQAPAAHLPEVSSTEIRRLCRQKNWDRVAELVPPPVCRLLEREQAFGDRLESPPDPEDA